MSSEVALEPAHVTGPSGRSTSRRLMAAIAVGVLALLGVVALMTLRHLDGNYGPIEPGATAGPFTLHNISSGTDGVTLSLSPVPGATAQIVETVRNDGSHSVQITSVPTDEVVNRIRWSTYELSRTQSNLGDPEPWHRFPATVPAHGVIRLLVTIHRPASCGPRPLPTGAAVVYAGDHVVHWRSLLGSHTTTIGFPGDYGIRVC